MRMMRQVFGLPHHLIVTVRSASTADIHMSMIGERTNEVRRDEIPIANLL